MQFYKETLETTGNDVMPIPGLECRCKFTYLKAEEEEEEKYLAHAVSQKG